MFPDVYLVTLVTLVSQCSDSDSVITGTVFIWHDEDAFRTFWGKKSRDTSGVLQGGCGQHNSSHLQVGGRKLFCKRKHYHPPLDPLVLEVAVLTASGHAPTHWSPPCCHNNFLWVTPQKAPFSMKQSRIWSLWLDCVCWVVVLKQSNVTCWATYNRSPLSASLAPGGQDSRGPMPQDHVRGLCQLCACVDNVENLDLDRS